jgi:hypothetical protein
MKKMILALMVIVTCYYNAQATPLPPGGSGVIPSPNPGLPGAALLASHVGVAWMTPGGLVHGTATTAVYSDPTNVFGAGDLTFVYQVTNDMSSVDGIARLTMINFAGFLTDVQMTLAGPVIPGGIFALGSAGAAAFSADRSALGDTVGFNFPMGSPNNIHPGDTSWVMIIQTNATHFTDGFLFAIDGGVATIAAFGPTTVPDGGSAVALLGIALAGLEGVRRMFRGRKA